MKPSFSYFWKFDFMQSKGMTKKVLTIATKLLTIPYYSTLRSSSNLFFFVISYATSLKYY
jgi:hypothetical protein